MGDLIIADTDGWYYLSVGLPRIEKEGDEEEGKGQGKGEVAFAALGAEGWARMVVMDHNLRW